MRSYPISRAVTLALVSAFGFALGAAVATLSGCGAAHQPPPPVTPPVAAPSSPAPGPVPIPTARPERGRFEQVVRADFFSGIAGDAAAFARAVRACDDALAEHPDDAEPLVWRGAGRLFEAGMAFRDGNPGAGHSLWDRALDEMDRAVALAPDDLGVRIPRGAALLGALPYLRDPAVARSLYARVVADYETTLRLQSPYFESLSVHAREELLFGLADAEAKLGEVEKARPLFERLAHDLPDSRLVPYARAWLAGDGPPPARPPCAGCHAR